MLIALLATCLPSGAQCVGSWVLHGPPHGINLVQVTPSAGGIHFELDNISSKAIIEFLVAAPDGNKTGLDAFMSPSSAVPPGGRLKVNFGVADFAHGACPDETLQVEGVVFSDGSHVGTADTLRMLEDRMLGEALETKRDIDLLAGNPDQTAAGLDSALDQISRTPPSTPAGAANTERGIALAGVPPAYIRAHINAQSSGLLVGVSVARQNILLDLNNGRSAAAGAASLSPKLRQKHPEFFMPSESSFLTDYAEKYRKRSAIQSEIVNSFRQGETH
jgi:hypothetical protein